MFSITREFTFCYGHRLINYNGKCAHLHGHNGKVLITLESEQLDEQGMVMDFTNLKNAVGKWIEEKIDHKMVLRYDDPMVEILTQNGESLYLMKTDPTAENFCRLFYDLVKELGLPIKSVQFWETEKCSACYSESR